MDRTVEALGPPASVRVETRGPVDGLVIGRWRHGDAEIESGGGGAVVIVMDLSDTQRVERRRAGRWSGRPCGVGLVTIADPEEVTGFRIMGRADVLQLFLPLAFLAEVGGNVTARPVRAHFHEALPGIERCGWRALVALRDGEAGDALLLSAIACRLAEQLAERPGEPGRARGGLSRSSRNRVDQLIAHRLEDPVATSPSLHELAAEAGLNVFHFAHAFRQCMGVAPYAYMLHRRLMLARRLLLDPRTTVAEAGRRAGFASPAHFVAKFRSGMGVTPGAFKRSMHHNLSQDRDTDL